MRHSLLSGSSVLAIDNNGMLLDMMKEMYKQSGVECDTCLTVGELTDLMRTKDYDLLITDLKMPEMNGYEILELLRTSEVGNSQTIPIVAATAAGYVTEDELRGKGFASVLYKPYSIDELLAVTESCTKQKQPDRIDLSPLLAFGDKRCTLEKLATMTQTDMEGVCKAAEAKDKEALDGWVHHLRSSWMLIKAEQSLVPLYDAIHKESITDEELNTAVDAVLAQGSLIIDLARKEAERWAEWRTTSYIPTLCAACWKAKASEVPVPPPATAHGNSLLGCRRTTSFFPTCVCPTGTALSYWKNCGHRAGTTLTSS